MWNLKVIDVSKPLYIAIVDALERDIRAGLLGPGDRLPTHRELAKTVGVTVTTITRAYREAEKRGLISAMVGSGTFVASDLGARTAPIYTQLNRNLIEMGLVYPLYGLEPGLRQCIEGVLARDDLTELMKYVPPQGLPRHRRIGANWMRRYGYEALPDQVVLTAGAQHAINCVFQALFRPGERLAVDYLTYPGVKAAARLCGIRLEGVLLDEQGMLPEELEALCGRGKVRGLFLLSGPQNPTGALMSPGRQAELAEVIRRHDLTLLEESLPSFLPPKPPPPLSARLPERSIFIAELSKAFYAGLRVAFLAAPEPQAERVAQVVNDTIWMTSPLAAEIVCESIESGWADKVLRRRRKEVARRAALLREKFTGLSYCYAEGNMFVWLKLPPGWSGRAFAEAAEKSGVRVLAAEKFIVGSLPPPDYIRIALSGAEKLRDFTTGLDILAGLLKSKKTNGGAL